MWDFLSVANRDGVAMLRSSADILLTFF